MGVTNVLQACKLTGGNTGVGSCFVDIGFIKGIIFVKPKTTLSTTTIAGLKTALEALLLEDNPVNRAYPVQGLVAPTDNSEAPVEQTFADGSKAIVRDGFYDWTFQFVKGGLCLEIALRKANGLNRWFYLVDDRGKLWGTVAGVDEIGAINPNLNYTPPFKLNTGAAVTEYSTRISFSPDQLNENAAYVDFTNDGGLPYLTGLSGLENITLSKVSRALGVIVAKAATSCGTVDIHSLYASELASAGLWVAKNAATGALITITSVADNVNAGGWTITLDATDPDYTAAAVLLSLAGPTELDAADVSGYESNVISVTI